VVPRQWLGNGRAGGIDRLRVGERAAAKPGTSKPGGKAPSDFPRLNRQSQTRGSVSLQGLSRSRPRSMPTHWRSCLKC
jgi:hypothetical protein